MKPNLVYINYSFIRYINSTIIKLLIWFTSIIFIETNIMHCNVDLSTKIKNNTVTYTIFINRWDINR